MNWKRASVVTAAVAVPVIGLFALGLKSDPRQIPSPLPGRAAPEFSLAVMPNTPEQVVQSGVVPTGGDTVRLAELRGQVVVLNFYASWCLACRDEHRPLSDMAEAYAGKPVRFFGVLYNDTDDNARRWIAEMGGQSYATLRDPKSRTAIEYGLYGVPETFFIAPDGKVAHKQIGPVTAEILAKHIEALLPQVQGKETE